MRVEIFKTNVREPQHAQMLLAQIHLAFKDYRANFDLQDCDHILRVENPAAIEPELLIRLLKDCGFTAELLN